MRLHTVDILIILAYLASTVVIGLVLKKVAERSKSLGRKMLAPKIARIIPRVRIDHQGCPNISTMAFLSSCRRGISNITIKGQT